jgi:hypothetical protein
VTSVEATVTVEPDPAITAQPQDDAICEGGTSTLSVTATGAPSLDYQWQSSSVSGGPYTDIPGATNASYTTGIQNVTTYYRVVVSSTASGCEGVTSVEATVTVEPDPAITAEPQDDAICEGGTSTLSVTATGAPSLDYQWQSSLNAGGPFADISGATNTSYTTGILSITTYYQVVISSTASGCDGVTSVVATVTVEPDPAITAQPQDDAICEGGTSTLSVTATGAPSLDYQWQISSSLGGPYTDIGGATDASYTTAALSVTTYYRVNVTGSASGCDGVTSVEATVTVEPDPAITAEPQDDAICEGGTSTLSVTATGAPSLDYQWQISSSSGGPYTDIGGATNTSYTTAALSVTTYYRVNVTGSASGCDGVTSVEVTVTVEPDPAITAQPQDDAICEGGTSTLSVSGCDGVTSVVATVTVEPDPAITAQPQDDAICEGGTSTLSVTATGAPSLDYQWQSSSSSGGPYTDIGGATNASYTTASLFATTYYQVVISSTASGCDGVTSDLH